MSWTDARQRAWEQRKQGGEWPYGQPVGFGPAGPWPESHGGERCPSQALIGHVGVQHESAASLCYADNVR